MTVAARERRGAFVLPQLEASPPPPTFPQSEKNKMAKISHFSAS